MIKSPNLEPIPFDRIASPYPITRRFAAHSTSLASLVRLVYQDYELADFVDIYLCDSSDYPSQKLHSVFSRISHQSAYWRQGIFADHFGYVLCSEQVIRKDKILVDEEFRHLLIEYQI